jgi:hypothetical protein
LISLEAFKVGILEIFFTGKPKTPWTLLYNYGILIAHNNKEMANIALVVAIS